MKKHKNTFSIDAIFPRNKIRVGAMLYIHTLFAMVRMEPRVSYILVKYSTAELCILRSCFLFLNILVEFTDADSIGMKG